MPSLTIGYLTSRWDCRFEWFANGLVRELRGTGLSPQVVVVDSKLWTDKAKERRREFLDKVAGRFEFLHVPPKPTVWQGPHRRTSRDFFCAANSRNTIFAYASGEHVIFVDDLSVLMPGWLAGHLHAAENGYVLCGMTSKHRSLRVDEEGRLQGFDSYGPHDPRTVDGIDSRMRFLDSDGPMPADPAWVYGGTFSVPFEVVLRVNGQDEIYDGIGGEDWDFGVRLHRLGCQIMINRTCGTIEDEELHQKEPPMIQLDKPVGDTFSSNILLGRLKAETDRVTTIARHFDLLAAREALRRGEPFPVPHDPAHHWVDGQPLEEL